MNIFFWVCYLKAIEVFQKIYFKDLLGCDQRYTFYPNTFKEDNTSLDIIRQMNKNKTIADFLESRQSTVQTKLDTIETILGERINPGIFNLYEGGLFNDWNLPNFAE